MFHLLVSTMDKKVVSRFSLFKELRWEIPAQSCIEKSDKALVFGFYLNYLESPVLHKSRFG